MPHFKKILLTNFFIFSNTVHTLFLTVLKTSVFFGFLGASISTVKLRRVWECTFLLKVWLQVWKYIC